MYERGVREICVTVFESLCAMREGGRSLRQPNGNGGWSFTEIKTASEGNSINITCSTSEDLRGIFLKKTWPKTWPENENVIYFEDGENATVDKNFTDRIDFSGSQSNLTITMRLLRREDSGLYTCHAVRTTKKEGPSTMVVVTGKECPHLLLARPGSRWLPGASLHFLELSVRACLLRGLQLLPPSAAAVAPSWFDLKASSRISYQWFFLFVFPEKVSQETYRSHESQGTSISLLAVMAVGFFFIGLVLGMLCMLRKTQVSMSLCSYQRAGPPHGLTEGKTEGFRPKIWSEALKTQRGVNEASCRDAKWQREAEKQSVGLLTRPLCTAE